MALFSKKTLTADTIISDCTVFTMNPEQPTAEAICVAEGKIIFIGSEEQAQAFCGKNTEELSLEGRYVLPGFIETQASPVADVFDEDVCCVLDPEDGPEEIAEKMSAYIEENEDREVYFAYGMDLSHFADKTPSDRIMFAEEIADDKPLFILSQDGFGCIMNKVAAKIVSEALDEDDMDIATIPYIVSVLDPIDQDAAKESFKAVMEGYIDEGYTTVFPGAINEVLKGQFKSLLFDAFNLGYVLQRYAGGFYLGARINPTYVVSSLLKSIVDSSELDGLFFKDSLHLVVNDDSFDQGGLEDVAIPAAERGFHIIMDLDDENAVTDGYNSLEAIVSKGNREATFAFRYDYDLEDFTSEGGSLESLDKDALNLINIKSFPLDGEEESPEDTIMARTIKAAEILGLSDVLGSLEEGKYCDLAVFDENPYEYEGEDEDDLLPAAAMTFIGGQLVAEDGLDDLFSYELEADWD